jgi:hypothetical protein
MYSLVLQRHIDAAFDAFDLEGSGKLYVGDAVLALDALLVARWGNRGAPGDAADITAAAAATPRPASGAAAGKPSSAMQLSSSAAPAGGGSGAGSEQLTLPGVTRSKILQAIKHALLKANVDPDAAVSSRPVVTLELLHSAAAALLVAPANVADIDAFAAFQSLNGHVDRTRVDRIALRRSLLAEYDADVYVKRDEDDALDQRVRSGSAYGLALPSGDAAARGGVAPRRAPRGSAAVNAVGAGKFDGMRSLVGCDDLLLARFAQYPAQGLSFSEWRTLMAPVADRKGREVTPTTPVVRAK